MLLTSVQFKWLISDKIGGQVYDTYLEEYCGYGLKFQILIMLTNGAMLFVRIRDEDGEMDADVLQQYDYVCFTTLLVLWLVYQFYFYFILVPRILKEQSMRLIGMTNTKFLEG